MSNKFVEIGLVLSVVFVILPEISLASIYNSLILNSDFADYNVTDLSINNYDWTYSAVPSVASKACNNLICQLQTGSNNSGLGFVSNSFSFLQTSGNDNDAPSLYSDAFEWNSNISWGVISFYARNLNATSGGHDIDLFIFEGGTQIGNQANTIANNNATAKYTYNFTQFVDGHSYNLYIRGRTVGALIYISNITLYTVNSSLYMTTLTGSCNINNFPYSSIPLSCETDKINTKDCLSFSDAAQGYISMQFQNKFDADLNTTIYAYGFNASAKHTEYSSYVNWYVDRNVYDFSTSNYANKSVFSTCFFYNNNTNITPLNLYCELNVECYINSTLVIGDCAKFCENNILYENGTYNATLGICQNWQSVSKCAVGCGSWTSCSIGSGFNQSTQSWVSAQNITAVTVLNVVTVIMSYDFLIVFGISLFAILIIVATKDGTIGILFSTIMLFIFTVTKTIHEFNYVTILFGVVLIVINLWRRA